MNAPTGPLSAAAAIYIELRSRLSVIYELAEDDEALLDTLDGETDLTEQIAAVLRESKAVAAMADGLSNLLDAMQARKVRLEAKAANLRSTALWAMQETGQKKLSAPDMTVSVMPGKPKMVIDLDKLSLEFQTASVSYKADRDKIQARVDEGDVPEGVEIMPPKPFLTIRSK